MNPNFVIVRTPRDANGKDISKEWKVLFGNQKLEDIKLKKAKQNLTFIGMHALAYTAIVLLSRRG